MVLNEFFNQFRDPNFFDEEQFKENQKRLANFLKEQDMTLDDFITEIQASDRTGKNEVAGKAILLSGGRMLDKIPQNIQDAMTQFGSQGSLFPNGEIWSQWDSLINPPNLFPNQ